MSELHEELLQIADKIELYAKEAEQDNIILPLSKLGEAVSTVTKAWSGSWLGYHASVYYNNLQPPPTGAHFSQEWGMEKLFVQRDGTTGDWREYNNDEVIATIHTLAGNPDLDLVRKLSEKAEKAFDTEKHEVLSLLSTVLAEKPDTFISNLKDDVEKLHVLSQSQVIGVLRPSGQLISRDSLAVTQGFRTPPHILVLSEVMALQKASTCCQKLSQIARRASSHLARQTRHSERSKEIGTHILRNGKMEKNSDEKSKPKLDQDSAPQSATTPPSKLPISEDEIDFISKSLLKRWRKGFYTVLVVMILVFGGSILGIYRNAVKKIESILIERISKEFEEPTIKATVQKVADNQAASMLKDEVFPYIESFKIEINAELEKVKTKTDIPSLALMMDRVRTVKNESDYKTTLVFRPSNRLTIGSTVFMARVISDSEVTIKDFFKTGITEGVKKSIIRNGTEAIYHCRLEAYNFPELKLVTTGPATILIYGAHLSEQPVAIEVKLVVIFYFLRDNRVKKQLKKV